MAFLKVDVLMNVTHPNNNKGHNCDLCCYYKNVIVLLWANIKRIGTTTTPHGFVTSKVGIDEVYCGVLS